MDAEKAQKIITEGIGPDYVIYKIDETEKYSFAYYKHQNYYLDDERGRMIGVGPVVFIKETGEYKLLGSGEVIFGGYFDFSEEVEPEPFQNPSLEQIKKDILRRNYVNMDDLSFLEINWIEQFENPSMTITFQRGSDFNKFIIAKSKNSSFLDFLKEFWSDLNLDFEMIAEDELMLCRINEKL